MNENLKTFYVAAKAVIVDPSLGQALVLLMEKANGEKYWSLPGGRIEGGDTLEQTLEREIKEEVPSISNYSLGKFLNAHRLSHDLDDGTGLVLIFYKVETDLTKVQVTEEHAGYILVSASDLSELNGRDGAGIEDGYLKALELALV